MNLIHVIILSLVEGLTEFLPISSTGHLILAAKLLDIPATDFVKTFQIMIQMGAILAVVVLYFKKFATDFDLLKKLFVAFIPTAIVGFTLYPLIKEVLLGSSVITLWALLLGGIVIILIEKLLKNSLPTMLRIALQAGKTPKLQESKNKEPTYKQALVIGCFQSVSIVPGVSRAAATIVGGLLTGLDRTTATEFSFLLAVPTMFAATGLDAWKSREMIAQGGFITLFVGTTLSFFFAMLAVKFLIGYVKKHDFTAFGVYRIILAILFWIFVM